MFRTASAGLVVCLLLGASCVHATTFLDCVSARDLKNPGTDTQPLAALRAHNCARRTVVPAARSPIAPLTWNSAVATIAQTYSNTCVYQHSGRLGYGENLFAAASSEPRSSVTMKDAVIDWFGEQPHYNYAKNTCSGVCGHYTQVVWATTSQVGCGLTRCTQNSPFGQRYPNWYFVVCNYLPAGNGGGRPY